MKNQIPMMVVLCIYALGLGYFLGRNNPKVKKPTILIDMNRGLQKQEGDSIWWQMPKYVVTHEEKSQDGFSIRTGYSEPQDTIFGFVNYNPLVTVIIGNDTMGYRMGDTVRYDQCDVNTGTATFALAVDDSGNIIKKQIKLPRY